MDREWLEQLLILGYSLERIGRLADKHPSTVSYWIKRHGLVASNHHKYAPKGGIPEESLREGVEAGLSVPQLASRFSVSASTVRYWLDQYGLSTVQSRRITANRDARARGVVEQTMTCGRHGDVTFRLGATGRYRCVRCNSEGVSRRRRRIKEILVREAGARCALCGYDRYLGALQFHHLEPHDKAFSIGHDGITRSLALARGEARKCVLLCGNCHAEVEGGLATISAAKRHEKLI